MLNLLKIVPDAGIDITSIHKSVQHICHTASTSIHTVNVSHVVLDQRSSMVDVNVILISDFVPNKLVILVSSVWTIITIVLFVRLVYRLRQIVTDMGLMEIVRNVLIILCCWMESVWVCLSGLFLELRVHAVLDITLRMAIVTKILMNSDYTHK